jgi:NADH-quinone oxidoreductase subunit N
MIGVLNSIVALYYYLIVVKVMYVDPGKDEDKPIVISAPYAWVLGVSSVVVLFLGVIPTQIIDWARAGAEAIQIALRMSLL